MTTYISLLQSTLKQKQQHDQTYSLRSLARDVELSSGFLSQILSGKRLPSEETALTLAKKLKLSASQTETFVNSLRLAKVKTPEAKRYLKRSLNAHLDDTSFFQLDAKHLGASRGWLGFALLELLSLKSSKSDVAWMAKKLDVSFVEAVVGLERLIEAGLVKLTQGTYKRIVGNVTTPYMGAKSIRESYRSYLLKAIAALEEQAPEKNDFSVMNMAVDPRKLPEAKRKIQNFRRELMEFLEDGERSEVYALNVNLFRLDKDLP